MNQNINTVAIISEELMKKNVETFIKTHVSNICPKVLRKAITTVNRDIRHNRDNRHHTKKYLVSLFDKYFDRRYCIKLHYDEYTEIYIHDDIIVSQKLRFTEIKESDTTKSLMLQQYLPYVNFIIKGLNDNNETIIDAITIYTSIAADKIISTSKIPNESDFTMILTTNQSDTIIHKNFQNVTIAKVDYQDAKIATAILAVAIKISDITNSDRSDNIFRVIDENVYKIRNKLLSDYDNDIIYDKTSYNINDITIRPYSVKEWKCVADRHFSALAAVVEIAKHIEHVE